MRVQKFTNDNWDDLEPAVLEETPLQDKNLGFPRLTLTNA